jgi:hypothetical protein
MLWRIGGNDAGYPSDLPRGVDPASLPRACDISKTRLEFDTSFPLNTYGELPVREILGVSFYTGFGTKPLQVRVPRGPDGTTQGRGVRGYQQIEEINPKGLEPWCLALKSYDRPISSGKVWVPVGWPERKTALKLTDEEFERYRSRENLELDPVQLVDIHYEIDPAVHAQVLPPITKPGAQSLLRILGARVESSDLSTRPFTELWLLGRCEIDARPTWYAMSHIVSWDGDVINGREIFGYPSKLGAPELFFDPLEASVFGRRVHRDFFYATVPLSLEELAPSEERLEILGLQTRALKKRDTPFWGDWILQPWTIRLEQGRVARPEEVVLAFPADPAPGDIGMTDPWFELAGGTVVRAVAGRGRMLRFPGRYAGEVDPETLERFTYERHDGISNMLGGAPPRGTPTRSTFLVRDLAVPGAKDPQTAGD